MTMKALVWLALSAPMALAGPMSYLKPGLASQKAEQEELIRQVEAMRRADDAAKAGLPPPPKVSELPPPEAPAAAAAVATKRASRLAIGGLVKRMRLPVVAAAAGYAAWQAHAAMQAASRRAEQAAAEQAAAEAAEAARVEAEDRAASELQEAVGALQRLLGSKPKLDEPANGDLASQTELAAELRRRASVLEELLPMYRQLDIEDRKSVV